MLGVLGAPLTLVLHEFSHVIATWATGGKVTLFRPWPHRYEGRWWIGRMMRDGGSDLAVKTAPGVKAHALLLAYGVAANAWAPLFMLVVWELVDFGWWWRGWIWRLDHTDGGHARRLRGL